MGIVRIISGRWRRRLLRFPDIAGLRPTHDRIRETLFNWLMPCISDATCLDLFAGSGALGFEALSRGAKRVTFIDKQAEIIVYLKKVAADFELSQDQVEIIQAKCPEEKLSLSFSPYDIVFLDPPFHKKQLPELVRWLETCSYLAQSARFYVEMERQAAPLGVPGWCCLKEGHTARISYYLFQKVHEL